MAGDNQAAADQSGTQDQLVDGEQDKQEKETESHSGDTWKPIQNTDATEENKKAENTEAEKEDEKATALKQLPTQHSRGLMGTLIELIGPEALNRKPDPLPPPQPMKLEDDSEEYLQQSTYTPKLGISKTTFLESGITSKMLEEASMGKDYGDSEDMEYETDGNEFYCKLCEKQMTSLGNFRDHLNGKSHKSTLEAWKAGKKLPKGNKKAKSLSEVGQESVCLEIVEGEVEPILGLSYVTEYHSIMGIVCVCKLCAVKFDPNIVISHTTGCKHRLRYMREEKPSLYVHLKKFGGKKSQLTVYLRDRCVGVEREDGRGTPAIKVYDPEMIDDDDSLNLDEYENRQLINQAKRSATVEEKDLESVDFQDWVNREMRRAKEYNDSRKRSPSPGGGYYGRSTDTFRFEMWRAKEKYDSKKRSPSPGAGHYGRSTGTLRFEMQRAKEKYDSKKRSPSPGTGDYGRSTDTLRFEMRRAKEKYDSKKRSPSPGTGDYGRSTDTLRFEMQRAKEKYDSKKRSPSPGTGDYGRSTDTLRFEMQRAKEKYDSKKRSPSPGAGDYGRSTDTLRFGTERQMLPHSDVGGRGYPTAQPMFPHSHQGEMYMPPLLPPPPPPLPFPIRQTPERYDAYVGHGPLPPMTEQYVNPVSYSSSPVFYHAVDPGLDSHRHLDESRSDLISNNEVSEKKSAILFDCGQESRDEERDGIRTSRRSSRSRDREDISPSRKIAKRRADDNDISTSRKLAKSRADKFNKRSDIITFKQSARCKMNGRYGISTPRQKVRIIFKERDDVSTPRKKVKIKMEERDDVSTSKQKVVRSRMEEKDDISTSRQKVMSKADGRGEVGTSKQLDRSRADERDEVDTSKQLDRSRADERDEVDTSKQLDRSRADKKDEVGTSKHLARSRADEKDEVGTSKHLARSRADERDEVGNSRHLARSRADERDEVGISRQLDKSRADERNVSASVSRADKWEDAIQSILGHSGKKKPLDSLALLSRTYSSPEQESPSPPRRIKHPKKLPFSKTYLEVESKKSRKDRSSSNELHSDLDCRRKIVRKERFVEARPKSRSPDVTRVCRRSPEIYIVDSPQPSHLTRRQSRRDDSTELVYSQRGRSQSPRRSRSPVNVSRQQRRSRSPRDPSPVRSNKKSVIRAATPTNIDTDVDAERIANLLLELSSSLSVQEDPEAALQTLFSNGDLTRALLSSQNNTAGRKPSRKKSSGEKMHSARSPQVGKPPGRHYVNVEQQSRYTESPDPSKRYAQNYTTGTEQTHSLARPESKRVHGGTLKPTAHLSRERVALSVAGFNRTQGSLLKASLSDFEADSDES